MEPTSADGFVLSGLTGITCPGSTLPVVSIATAVVVTVTARVFDDGRCAAVLGARHVAVDRKRRGGKDDRCRREDERPGAIREEGCAREPPGGGEGRGAATKRFVGRGVAERARPLTDANVTGASGTRAKM